MLKFNRVAKDQISFEIGASWYVRLSKHLSVNILVSRLSLPLIKLKFDRVVGHHQVNLSSKLCVLADTTMNTRICEIDNCLDQTP